MKFDLIMIGTILNEIVKFPTKKIGPVLGSPAAYSSVAAAKLGMKTGIVTKIGSDMPKRLLKPFYEVEVDTRGIHTGKVTTTNLLIYDEQGNKILRYLKKAPPIYFSDIPNDYMSATIMHVCPMNYEVPLETVKSLKEHGIMLSVDLGGYGGATSTEHPVEKEDKRLLLKGLMKYFSIVRASVEDCRHIFGMRKNLEEYTIKEFIGLGADVAIVTLGERGVIASTKEGGILKIPAYPTNAIDPTGAGDVFCAGFLAEFIKTGDVWKAVLFGSTTASLMVEKTGGVLPTRMPTTEEVHDRILKYVKLIA